MTLGKREEGCPFPSMLSGLEAWRMPVRGTAAPPHLEPGPLQQQRPQLTPHRSPLIRPGVTYPESDTVTPNHRIVLWVHTRDTGLCPSIPLLHPLNLSAPELWTLVNTQMGMRSMCPVGLQTAIKPEFI